MMLPTVARFLRSIDAGDAEANSRRHRTARRNRFLHDRMEDLLELELSDRLKVRAGAGRGGHDPPVIVAEQAGGLGPPDVDAENVHGEILAGSDGRST